MIKIFSSESRNYKVLIDGRNFYDQPLNDLIKQYDELRKKSIEQCDDYATGCLLDYVYFNDNYRLIAFALSKQKALDANPRVIQQIVFQGKTGQKLRLYTILEKSRDSFRILQRNSKSFVMLTYKLLDTRKLMLKYQIYN